jgi:hypothetical protein
MKAARSPESRSPEWILVHVVLALWALGAATTWIVHAEARLRDQRARRHLRGDAPGLTDWRAWGEALGMPHPFTGFTPVDELDRWLEARPERASAQTPLLPGMPAHDALVLRRTLGERASGRPLDAAAEALFRRRPDLWLPLSRRAPAAATDPREVQVWRGLSERQREAAHAGDLFSIFMALGGLVLLVARHRVTQGTPAPSAPAWGGWRRIDGERDDDRRDQPPGEAAPGQDRGHP